MLNEFFQNIHKKKNTQNGGIENQPWPLLTLTGGEGERSESSGQPGDPADPGKHDRPVSDLEKIRFLRSQKRLMEDFPKLPREVDRFYCDLGFAWVVRLLGDDGDGAERITRIDKIRDGVLD